jgi:4-amino-4-deoxy-L-arabinose transferase-like glycosyltransferase
LRFLFLPAALIALYFGLRRNYLMTAFDLSEAIERARNIPMILAITAAVMAAMLRPRKAETKWSPALCGVILGASVGSLSCLALAIEFAELLRRMDYWNWWQDWIWIAPHLIVATVQGGAIGAFVLQVAALLWYRCEKRKAILASSKARFVRIDLARRRRPL